VILGARSCEGPDKRHISTGKRATISKCTCVLQDVHKVVGEVEREEEKE